MVKKKNLTAVDWGDILIQRYLPGVDLAKLSDEEWAIKVRMIEKIVETEKGV